MSPTLKQGLRSALGGWRKPGQPVPARAPYQRMPGPLIWICHDSVDRNGAALLARLLLRQRDTVQIVLSTLSPESDSSADGPAPDQRVQRIDPVPEEANLLREQIEALRPDLVVVMGSALPGALIRSCHAAGIAVVLADARPPAQQPGFIGRRQRTALLALACRIIARDPESAQALRREGASSARLELGGELVEPAEPLPCSETERASFVALTRTRPIWLAAGLPEEELELVLSAHTHALRHAHRMLLLLAPDAEGDAVELAERLSQSGWSVARRTLEGEPDEDIQIFIADDPMEYGLWYRLAPVCYMGGTLTGEGAHPRSPMEPAALGSAIIHGPRLGRFEAEYTRLGEARAARKTGNATALGEAVADLIAPDRAAILAHNAWAVSSVGAGAAEAVARAVLEELDRATAGRKS